MDETNEEKKFISMLSDYGFKVCFGNEHHPKFLRKALQALIDSDIPIRQVSFSKNELTGTTLESRGGLIDILCEDELGRVFIVEMQLLDFKPMIHRVKFYAFHRYNMMVKKGDYRFDDLRKIYTITILAGKTYATKLYHQIGTVKNQKGELMDDQITHVVIELGKFEKTLEQIETDLDKLLYTMKLTDTATKEAKLPDFMREGWLEETLKELDNAKLTPEQRADWEIAIARNMTAKYAMEDQMKKEIEKRVKTEVNKIDKRVKAEVNKKVKKAKSDAQKAEYDTKRKAIINLLNLGVLSVDQIAKVQEVSKQFVLSIQAEISGS